MRSSTSWHIQITSLSEYTPPQEQDDGALLHLSSPIIAFPPSVILEPARLKWR